MLPLSDCSYVKNELKALKYIQTEIIELNSLYNQLIDQDPTIAKTQSIYKQLILPLLSSIECGGFMIFASPSIFIPDYQEDSNPAGGANMLSPLDSAKAQSNLLQLPGQYEDFSSMHRDRSLSVIYGKNVFLNQKHVTKINNKNAKKEKGDLDSPFSFL